MLAEKIQSANVKNFVASERMKVYEASFQFDVEDAPPFSYFSNIQECVSTRDRIRITLQDENDRIYNCLLNDEDGYKRFIESTLADENIWVRLKIDKEVVGNHFSIETVNYFV